LKLSFRDAIPADAKEIAALRAAAADDLTVRFGKGFWSTNATDKGVLLAMKRGRVVIATRAGTTVGTMTLSTWKPWAIDKSYFAKAEKPLYLTSMAVEPKLQGQGVGRALLEAAEKAAREWPTQAIRLDAFDANAGAGGFYAKCGYKEVGRATFRSVPLIYYELLL
jgi:GNAT superfamily N-acetyltransferase